MGRLPPERVPGFRILRKLGEGASGSVFHAVQDGTDREVALKLFDPVAEPHATTPEQIEHERKVANALHHRHLVRVWGLGEHGERRWLACEYLSGGTLAERIVSGAIAPDIALSVLRDVVKGLGHAHANGVVHGDVKPGNILFRGADEAVLGDFGVAAFTQDGRLAAAHGGTPDYMSPEQARGELIDGRSDFYSLGVVLYEMLTGHVPPRDATGDRASYRYPVPKLAPRQQWLQPLLDALMAENSSERPYDARELLMLLSSLCAASPEASAMHTTFNEVRPRRFHGLPPKKVNSTWPLAFSAVVMTLVLLATVWFYT